MKVEKDMDIDWENRVRYSGGRVWTLWRVQRTLGTSFSGVEGGESPGNLELS